jgi:hypothetical protein
MVRRPHAVVPGGGGPKIRGRHETTRSAPALPHPLWPFGVSLNSARPGVILIPLAPPARPVTPACVASRVVHHQPHHHTGQTDHSHSHSNLDNETTSTATPPRLMTAPSVPLGSTAGRLPFSHRRQALVLALLALALARSAPLGATGSVIDAVTLKRWREMRRTSRDERKRREAETPL